MAAKPRVLVVTYDVTDLTIDEIDQLEIEAVVQHEGSDGHPTIPMPTTERFERWTATLTPEDTQFVSESLSTLADLDEGEENVDYDRLKALSERLGREAVLAPCDVCGSTAVERADDGTLLGCTDCGYEAPDGAAA